MTILKNASRIHPGLRFGFFGNKTGKTIDNAYIQADYGLN